MAVKIVDVPRVISTSVYRDDVAAVRDSGKAGMMTFPADEIKTHVNRLHVAAKHLGVSVKTLAKTERVEDGVDVVDVTFIVRERQTRPRDAKAELEDGAEAA